ncbi:hypothetical protein A2999_00315 [Candidatus Wolfebacteria bacterium RIFCSPLOWO2_01_FULL_38_11]|uniref:Phosphoribosyltransferase domain-containing protein n=1 Tax=Candidatus Wolfebacteria bacterium RIFCSPLOWO2_01_FULL_38_11 TaxID=1802556 RepID=A0A1F8DRD8_9BACT|nr:MAG: hypothetical protein A2999_00315 [Candidatus Wolfebacteria bacterium RIFCSPLOWO2_01_FULL_38_11]
MYLSLIKVKNLILEILFPSLCLNCKKYLPQNEILCQFCLDSIRLNTALVCPICRKRLPENKSCRHGKKYFYFLAAAGNYSDPILQNLIHYFKYKNFQNLAPFLVELLIKYLNSPNLKFHILNSKPIVIPVPLHHSREKQRGYNQSKLIAEILSKKLNFQLIEAVKRTKNNKPQANLKNIEKRVENVKNCFEIPYPELIKNKNILLVDDVYTSGATMNEMVKILKENGARRIIAAVIAKA